MAKRTTTSTPVKSFSSSPKASPVEETRPPKVESKATPAKPPVVSAPTPVAKVPMEGYYGPFPDGMFIDRDEPKRHWKISYWCMDGKQSPVPPSHTPIGKPGTEFEGYIFVRNATEAPGGHWERPIKDKK